MSLLNSVGSVGAWVRGFMVQTLAWMAWVAWFCKILAWVKKMAWVPWVEILAWVAWVHKISLDPNFGIGQKNGLCQNKMK